MKIRKELRPEDVVAIRDNRENYPIDLSPLKVIQGTLPTGDFSLVGLEHKVAVERKSLQDLIMCCGRERERFEKEIQRLMAYETKAIIVEASWSQIELKSYRGDMHPSAVMGSLLGWISMGMPIIMAESNDRAGRFISRILFTAARRHWRSCLPWIEAQINSDLPIAQ